MKSIRKNTFETNSSSSHSLTVNSNLLVSSQLNPYYDWSYRYMNGPLIQVPMGEFCSWCNHTSQEDRLSYLVLLIINKLFHGNELWCCDSDTKTEVLEKLFQDEEYLELCAEIAGHHGDGVVGIIPSTEGYIDHGSDDYSSMWDFLNQYGLTINEFVFGEDVCLHYEFCG
jgi:hypothetical protein